MRGQLRWLPGGIALGLTFLLAVLLVKPIGVSTQFVIMDGIVWNMFSDDIVQKDPAAKSGYKSSNAYLNKSGGKYAKHVAQPATYSFIFALAMILGGFLSLLTGGPHPTKDDRTAPQAWRDKFGSSRVKRYLHAFFGGMLVLIGARLAGGCTSGHMMSGMMQTSVSGYLFAIGAFVAAVPVAIIMYRKN